MTVIYKVYKTNGDIHEVTCPTSEVTLKDLRGLIGCKWVEVVQGTDSKLICDEDGLMTRQPINVNATLMYQKKYKPIRYTELRGNVVEIIKGELT